MQRLAPTIKIKKQKRTKGKGQGFEEWQNCGLNTIITNENEVTYPMLSRSYQIGHEGFVLPKVRAINPYVNDI